MIVVSDTSPLNYLILINAIDVLPRLFPEIHAPALVMDELRRLRAPESARGWADSPPQRLRVSTPATTVATSVRLDPGEAQAIALAKELRADAILIDERKGWRVAKGRLDNKFHFLDVGIGADRRDCLTGENGDNRETWAALTLFSPSTLFPLFARFSDASFISSGIWINSRRNRRCN